ncbi:hypothetical protein [Psychroserpens algicola]|uniref:Uncharacterized protein n=1 Tax=Psychroserpens algicola TaxID=1719034 RepID=A0ABT0HC31_9FLAO|nr:hypothetical protein [Psychroserpens algicola]MCK8481925.1 hypothetical protein [Psychroserpens algicola]
MKKLESLKGSKFELSKDEINIHGGRAAGGWKSSYKYEDTAPEDGGGCDQVMYDLCWVV